MHLAIPGNWLLFGCKSLFYNETPLPPSPGQPTTQPPPRPPPDLMLHVQAGTHMQKHISRLHTN